jgi:nicotinate-nucleotide--dimethylbenzimidazole phosphoribosyltransferase
MADLEQIIQQIKPLDENFVQRARARMEQLAMPYWALGRLMDLAVELATMTRSMQPSVQRRTVVTMAADHGVAAEGMSQYPPEVTLQMVRNFARGGAASNALAQVGQARLVVDMGVAGDLDDLNAPGQIIDRRVRQGTDNMAHGPAMSRAEALRCVESGIELAFDLAATTDVFGTGDMGIGNTTPSAAIAAVLTGARCRCGDGAWYWH